MCVCVCAPQEYVHIEPLIHACPSLCFFCLCTLITFLEHMNFPLFFCAHNEHSTSRTSLSTSRCSRMCTSSLSFMRTFSYLYFFSLYLFQSFITFIEHMNSTIFMLTT